MAVFMDFYGSAEFLIKCSFSSFIYIVFIFLVPEDEFPMKHLKILHVTFVGPKIALGQRCGCFLNDHPFS